MHGRSGGVVTLEVVFLFVVIVSIAVASVVASFRFGCDYGWMEGLVKRSREHDDDEGHSSNDVFVMFDNPNEARECVLEHLGELLDNSETFCVQFSFDARGLNNVSISGVDPVLIEEERESE